MKITGTSTEEWVAIPREAENIQWLGDLPRGKAELWALVLESRGIPFRMERSGHGLQLLVPAAHMAAAVDELSLFEEENRDWPPLPRSIPPHSDNTLSTLSILVLVAVFHNLIRLRVWLPGKMPPDWLAIGSADSEKILQGQWWRLVTALTLHADSMHLLGNLAIGGIFIVFLCRYLGSGLAWTMLLAAGVMGNFGNALLQPVSHESIGSSTLVFGAVGLLAALNITGMRRHSWRGSFLSFAGAAALLALLGTEGERVDLGAHLCGFASGAVLGLAAGFLVERFGRPGRLSNVLLSSAAAFTVAAAWLLAVG